jgi:hypothetical protein
MELIFAALEESSNPMQHSARKGASHQRNIAAPVE